MKFLIKSHLLLSLFSFAILVVFLLPAQTVSGQKVSYLELARQNSGQPFYLKQYLLPGDTESTSKFTLVFKTSHSFMAFKKIDNANQKNPEAKKYFATLEMNIEVFKNPQPPKKGSEGRSFSQQGLQSVARSFWKDTVYTTSYEQTQASNLFMEGHFAINLPPGRYGYILQLVRTEGANEETSRQQVVTIPEYGKPTGQVYFIEPDASFGDGNLNLINFGSNVHYGKDFKALIHFPAYNPFRKYELNIIKTSTEPTSSTKKDTLLKKTITKEMVHNNYDLSVGKNKSRISLLLNKVKQGHSFAFVSIPNSDFPNATYQLIVTDKEVNEPVADANYQSRWVNMPTSLLNVDIALEMLRFILPKEKVKEMTSGSQAQKQKAFENFWKPKDPTPDTEYNELMAEYYRRIDYAFQNFSSFNVPGYDTDQGKIYIKYGPPKNIKREFPVDQPVIEIWKYDDRTFVFRATSGFGDFKLVETKESS